jgi:hypothetical protein
MTKLFKIFIFMILCCQVGLAQEMLYMSNDSKEAGKINSIEAGKIDFSPAEPPNAPKKTIELANVLALFNAKGDYLMVAGGKVDEKAIASFLNPPVEARSADVIIARNAHTVFCQITGEDMDKFTYFARGGMKYTVPKAEVGAVIRKDGRHQVFGPISAIAPQLSTALPEIKPGLVAARELAADAKKYAPKDSGAVDPNSLEAAVAKGELALDINLYKRKALQKVEDLGRYIKKIADKRTDLVEANKTVDLAVLLFLNEDKIVEVSQGSSEQKARFKIRSYLNKLKLLKYENVSISWQNISYVSNLRKGVDGNYYGIVSFDQVFEAVNEGEIVYRDLTRKNIEVILTSYKKQVDGQEKDLWDIFLSDIGVKQTRT